MENEQAKIDLMNKDVFIKDLSCKNLSFITSKWLIERVPYIFHNEFDYYLEWKELLSKLINVDSKAISIIGSACVGFSLNPCKNYRLFNKDSDIDIAIISHHHFDLAWHYLRNLGSSIYRLDRNQRSSVDDHIHRLIYWGTIATDKILPILPFGKDWTIALAKMALIQPSEGREINVRVYKDFESLRAYHVNNLAKLRNMFLEGEINE